ncbi:MAG: hypothetical protein ACI9JP_002680, partial [Granulosicoccus sp.]
KKFEMVSEPCHYETMVKQCSKRVWPFTACQRSSL